MCYYCEGISSFLLNLKRILLCVFISPYTSLLQTSRPALQLLVSPLCWTQKKLPKVCDYVLSVLYGTHAHAPM